MKKRNRLYLTREKFDRAYHTYYARLEHTDPDYTSDSPASILLRKRIMRTPKRANALLMHEAWQQEMSDICPND